MTARLPIPGQDDGDWGDILNNFLEVSLNSDGTLNSTAVSTAGAVQKGSLVYNVKDYGALGNGSSNDATAIQSAINAAQTAGGGIVFFPTGTYIVNVALNVTASIALLGCGTSSILKAGAALSKILNVDVNGLNYGLFSDLYFNGNSLATYCVSETTGVETSVGNRWVRCTFTGATSYQVYNNGCEDDVYQDCSVPGNESIPNTTALAIQIIVPEGNLSIIGGSFFGRCDLNYQQASVFSATIGPISISNPGAVDAAVLTLNGCYIYDGSVDSLHCIDTFNNLTHIVAEGCYFVAQAKTDTWLIGNFTSPGINIELRHCVFINASGSTGQMYIGEGSGAGTFSVVGGSTSMGGATIALFNSISTTSIIFRMPLQCTGVPAVGFSRVQTVNSSPEIFTNTLPAPVTVYVAGGTITNATIDGQTLGAISGPFRLDPNHALQLSWSSAPTSVVFVAD